MNISHLLTRLAVGGKLSCFFILAIKNNAAMIIHVEVFM